MQKKLKKSIINELDILEKFLNATIFFLKKFYSNILTNVLM